MDRFVFDTTFIVKGLIAPRRKKQDKELERQINLHRKAKEYLGKIERNEAIMIIPSFALVETASVVSRLTSDEKLAKDAVNFLRENAEQILFDYEILDACIEMGIKTKASGFDVSYVTVLKLTAATLLTDDSKMHKLAKENGFNSVLLREMV